MFNIIKDGQGMTDHEFDLDKIISTRSIETHFQPIISIKKKRIIGLEALTRATNPESGLRISPLDLFKAAEQTGKTVEIDRLCRDTAFAGFAPIHRQHPEILLFINFDTSMVDKGIVGSGNFLRMARKCGINTSNIVIELVESRVRDVESLLKFISMYRSLGFLIALDDFGAGHSNLERISRIKPEIIKIDRSLVQNVDQEFYKQEILRAIIKLSNQLGVMVLSEGVETYQEVMKTLEFDTDLLQGFFFSRPRPFNRLEMAGIADNIGKTASDHFSSVMKRIKKQEESFADYQTLADSILSRLKKNQGKGRLEETLHRLIQDHSRIECAFILDRSGRQKSATLLNSRALSKTKLNSLFRPADRGDDHSLKDYYVYLRAGLEQFITETYISLATGNLCRTIALSCTLDEEEEAILCLDMKENHLN
ncbi:MAG: EAL domain-containing protein [Desulfonatronovibrionaceae bacterium]